MGEVWSSLVPLIIGSALVPVQIIITAMLLRSRAGKITAVAWLAGMTTVRLAQGLVFGPIIGGGSISEPTAEGSDTAVSLLLLVVAIVFYVTAARQLLSHTDEDALPPKWMAMVASATPARAFALGVGIMLVGAKFWVFTLGAITAIGAADLDRVTDLLTFLLFVALAESIQIVMIGLAYAMPARATAMLDRITEFLATYNRVIMIGLGAVFGTWFLAKALAGLGVP